MKKKNIVSWSLIGASCFVFTAIVLIKPGPSWLWMVDHCPRPNVYCGAPAIGVLIAGVVISIPLGMGLTYLEHQTSEENHE